MNPFLYVAAFVIFVIAAAVALIPLPHDWVHGLIAAGLAALALAGFHLPTRPSQ
jgi:hypothetical protein